VEYGSTIYATHMQALALAEAWDCLLLDVCWATPKHRPPPAMRTLITIHFGGLPRR